MHFMVFHCFCQLFSLATNLNLETEDPIIHREAKGIHTNFETNDGYTHILAEAKGARIFPEAKGDHISPA